MTANPDCTYHVVGTQRDDHTQYARTDGTRAFTGTITAPAHAATGLTGATAASRYAGATASGAPGSGTFQLGDFVIDQTGVVWICTVAGSPGTWSQVGGASDTSWTNISSFTNGWTAGGTQPRFRKINNVVFLQGVLLNGTGNATAFTLPAGYRPAETTAAVCLTGTGTTQGNLIVNTDGTVVPVSAAGYNISSSFPTL